MTGGDSFLVKLTDCANGGLVVLNACNIVAFWRVEKHPINGVQHTKVTVVGQQEHLVTETVEEIMEQVNILLFRRLEKHAKTWAMFSGMEEIQTVARMSRR